MYLLGKVELPVSTLNLFENIIVCKIQKLSGHWTLGNLQYLSQISQKDIYRDCWFCSIHEQNYLGKLTWKLAAQGHSSNASLDATIAGQCFPPKGLGLRLEILRKESCKVGLASWCMRRIRIILIFPGEGISNVVRSRLLWDPVANLSPGDNIFIWSELTRMVILN